MRSQLHGAFAAIRGTAVHMYIYYMSSFLTFLLVTPDVSVFVFRKSTKNVARGVLDS